MTTLHDSNFNPAEIPISVFNATTALKVPIRENERPYDKAVKKANNALVEKWRKEVLNKLSDNKGNIQCGRVWESWQIYSEGKNLTSFNSMKEHLVRLNEEGVEFWTEFFKDLTVKELASYGIGVIDLAWFFLSNEVRIRMSEKKWDEVYSKSEDPLDWENTNASGRSVLRGEIFPILDVSTMKRMEEKVKAILKCSPRSFRKELESLLSKGVTSIKSSKILELMKIPIHKNDTPYDRVAAENMNRLLDGWGEKELSEEEYELSDVSRLMESWSIYWEGIGLQKYNELREQFPRMNDSTVKVWTDLFDREIEEIHAYGSGTVGAGWFLLQNENKLRAADIKLEKVYLGDDLEERKANDVREKEHIEGTDTSIFGDKLGDYGTKVGTILSIVVEPQRTGPRV